MCAGCEWEGLKVGSTPTHECTPTHPYTTDMHTHARTHARTHMHTHHHHARTHALTLTPTHLDEERGRTQRGQLHVAHSVRQAQPQARHQLRQLRLEHLWHALRQQPKHQQACVYDRRGGCIALWCSSTCTYKLGWGGVFAHTPQRKGSGGSNAADATTNNHTRRQGGGEWCSSGLRKNLHAVGLRSRARDIRLRAHTHLTP